MGYVPINRPLHFPSKMVKATKPAAKPRKTARTEDSEEPDPTPKRSRTAPKTPVTVQEEESNVGQSPIPETTKKLYQEDQDLAPVQVLDRVQFLHDLHMRVRDQIIEANLKITYYANQKRVFAENFKVGELVRLSLDGVELNKFKFRPSKKLNPVWYGPYRITGRPSEISCELDLQDDCYIQNVFPMSKLKLASYEQLSNLRPTPLPPSEDEEGEFELEKILDHDEKRKMYYCKWKNYDEIYRSTWEPRAHLAEGKTRAQTKILDAYEKKHDLVALLSEGEAENVASCLLDQSKNRKRQRLV